MQQLQKQIIERYEALGLSHLLIAQRWWGDGNAIEGSSMDCLAMTAWYAAISQSLHLITAIHPGFFQPSAIAKWGASISNLTGGRWSINVTSGWNMAEFEMYGIDPLDHSTRYQRSAEFVEVLRGAWANTHFSYEGQFYRTEALQLEPRPTGDLTVFQGGQSDAAIQLATQHSDWMFLNGGHPERVKHLIEKVRNREAPKGRKLKFALYAAPLCRPTDSQAWAEIDNRLSRLDHILVEQRKVMLGATQDPGTDGAKGMWQDSGDPLSHLDSNEGYCSRLIGSPETVWQNIQQWQALGIDMLHLDLRDELFCAEVLPQVHRL